MLKVISLQNVLKVLKREKYIKNKHPDNDFIYLWFIGVEPGYQEKGTGSSLLSEFIALSEKEKLPVVLETSTPENLPFYQKHGFSIYHTWQEKGTGLPLWFMKREPGTMLNVTK